MTAPSPLFKTVFAMPLEPRLTEGAVVAQARVIAPQLCAPDDPRLAIPDDHALRFLAQGAVGQLAIEWPDGVLAWAYIPGGEQLLRGMRDSMLEAYSRGRSLLEQIHLQHGQHAGNA